MAWLAGYGLRKKLTIDHTKVDADLGSIFTTRVFINADADIGANCNADGFDIRFTQIDGITKLSYERDSFEVVTGEATGNFWVKLPYVLSAEDFEFYIYYRPLDTADGSEEQEEVWDYAPKLICHLSDIVGSPTVIHDSSSRQEDGAKLAADHPAEAVGKIHKGQDFDGADYISSFANELLGVNYTFSGIVKPNAVTPSTLTQSLISYSSNSDVYPFVLLETYGALARFVLRDDAHTVVTAEKAGLLADTYYHLAGVREGNDVRIYVNGEEGTPDSAGIGAMTLNALDLGAHRHGTETRILFLDGIGDEFRIALVARTEAWIKADYHSCFNTLLSYGEQEAAAYRIYRGQDGVIDYESIIATMTLEQAQVSIGDQVLQPNTIWHYIRRKVTDCELESPDSPACIVRIDADGNMIANMPNVPGDLTIEGLSNGRFRLRWRYTKLAEEIEPTGFNIYIDSGSGFDFETPDDVVSYGFGGLGEFEWICDPLTHGLPYRFCVRSYKTDAGETQNTDYVSGIADAEGPEAISGLLTSWIEV